MNCFAQTPGANELPPDVAPFVSVSAATFVLEHVRVVDGTGAAAKEDQAIVAQRKNSVDWAGQRQAQKPDGAQVLDRTGYTVIPGLWACTIICITRIRSRCRLPVGGWRSPGFL